MAQNIYFILERMLIYRALYELIKVFYVGMENVIEGDDKEQKFDNDYSDITGTAWAINKCKY